MVAHDTIDLLANLEFVGEKLREECGWTCRNDVLRKLLPRLRKPYTERQVDGKLKSLTRSTDPKVIQDVYRHGISCIKGLNGDIKLKVQEELKDMKSEEVCLVVSTPRQLRSVSRHPETEMSRSKRASTIWSERTPTRSASRNHTIEASRSRRESTIHSEHTPTRAVQRTQRREPRARVLKLAEDEPLPKDVYNRDPPDQHSIAVQIQESLSRPVTTTSYTRIAGTEARIKSAQSSDTYTDGGISGVLSQQSDSQSFFYTTELHDTPAVCYDDLKATEQFPEKLVLDHSHETLRDLFNDNLYFRQKLSESEERRKKIDRNERLRHSLLVPGSTNVLRTMADTIETQNEKIHILQRQLSNQKFLQQFLSLGKGEGVPVNQNQIQIYHTKMRRDFRFLSSMDCFGHPKKTSAYCESQDLNELKSKIFGDMGCYPIGLVIQSLTGAAICEWVWSVKMQCTAMMNTPLLEGYRYHLRTVCGELALRNVDLAAHHWVINDEKHFQDEFLPRTSTRLSERLLNALGPFIKNAKLKTKLQIRLKSIFHSALTIKFLAMVGKNVFKFIWPAYNSVFERNFMVEELLEDAKCKQIPSEQERKKVRLPLVPGLVIYSHNRGLVDYCGFTKGDEEGLEQPSLVAQAVVVTL